MEKGDRYLDLRSPSSLLLIPIKTLQERNTSARDSEETLPIQAAACAARRRAQDPLLRPHAAQGRPRPGPRRDRGAAARGRRARGIAARPGRGCGGEAVFDERAGKGRSVLHRLETIRSKELHARPAAAPSARPPPLDGIVLVDDAAAAALALAVLRNQPTCP